MALRVARRLRLSPVGSGRRGEGRPEARHHRRRARDRRNEANQRAAGAIAARRDARAEWDEKSEKWQESDRGQEVNGWIDEWENAVSALPDEVELVIPAELDCPDLDAAELIDGLPEESP